MRTTVSLADDVAAAVERLRRERSIGVSEAVNELVRDGLVRRGRPQRFVEATHDLGAGVDYTNVAEALETLDGPAARWCSSMPTSCSSPFMSPAPFMPPHDPG